VENPLDKISTGKPITKLKSASSGVKLNQVNENKGKNNRGSLRPQCGLRDDTSVGKPRFTADWIEVG
jgi:hypothetical protein